MKLKAVVEKKVSSFFLFLAVAVEERPGGFKKARKTRTRRRKCRVTGTEGNSYVLSPL